MIGWNVLPIAGMVFVEIAQIGLIMFSKRAMSTGMSTLAFVLYSNVLASLILSPSLFTHGRSVRGRITFPLLCQFFVLAVFGYLAQISGYGGIVYGSPTLAAIMLNLIPAITFLLAVIFRLEELDMKSHGSIAKLLGTSLCVIGAFILTLCKDTSSMNSNWKLNRETLSRQSDWVIAVLLLTADCVMASAYLILQGIILVEFPAEMVVAFFYCFFVSAQAAAVCFVFEEEQYHAWALVPRTRLIAVVYSGVVGSAFQVLVSTWCVRTRGPLFVAMFKPLGIIVSVAIGVIFLGDSLHLKSLVTAALIVIGFYVVMWGKAHDGSRGCAPTDRTMPSAEQTPLLL